MPIIGSYAVDLSEEDQERAAPARLRYVERAPSPPLAQWVEAIWSVQGTHAPGEEVRRLVLPDGCMDVIFDLSAAEGSSETRFVVGTMTRPLPVLSSGRVHLVGARFRPGGALPFLDTVAHELVDCRAPLDSLWGGSAAEALERVHDGGMSALEELLAGRLRRARRDDQTVRRAAGLLSESRTPERVDDVASALALGRRQLERRFRDAVGVPPSTLVRILRFRRAIALLAARGEHSLSRIAAEAGYHDQPHMNRDFRELAGMTPGAYRATLGAS